MIMNEQQLKTLKKRALTKQLKSLGMTVGALATFALIGGTSIAANPGMTDPTTWLVVGVSAMICLPLPYLQLLLFSFNKGIRFHRLATYYVLEYAGSLYGFIGMGALKLLGTIGRAELYQEQVRYRDAQAVALKTLNEYTSKTNDPTLKSVIRLNALLAANIECKLSRYDRALQLCDEYFTPLLSSYNLTKNKSLYGDLGTALNQFGCVLDCLGRFKESLACYELSYTMRESTGDEQGDVSLCNVGFANLRLGNFEQAEKNLRDAMTIVKINGRIKSDVGASIDCNLGETLLELGRLDEARKHLNLALAERRHRLPQNSPDIAQVKGAYARLLAMEGNDLEAQKMFEECVTIYKNSTGMQNADAAILLKNFATFNESRDNTDKARSLKQQSDEIFAQLGAIQFPPNLAKCLHEFTGQAPEATSQADGVASNSREPASTANESASNESATTLSEPSSSANEFFADANANANAKAKTQATDDDGIVIDRSVGSVPGIHHSLDQAYKLASSQNWMSIAAIAYLFYLAAKSPTSASSAIVVLALGIFGFSFYRRHRRKEYVRRLNDILMTQEPAYAQATLCLEALGPLKNYVGIVRGASGQKANISFTLPDPDVIPAFNNKTSPVRVFKDPINEKIVAVATRLGIVIADNGFTSGWGIKMRLAAGIGALFMIPVVVSSVMLAALLVFSEPPPSVLPENLSAKEYYNLGKRYKGAGWIELSRQALDRAIKDGESDTKAKAEKYKNARLPRLPISKEAEKMNILGFNSQFNKDASEKTWRECIKKYPNFEWPYSNLGSQLTEQGRLDEAEVLLKKALELNPTYSNGLRNMAALKRKQGDTKAAEEYDERFRKSDPGDI